MKLSEFQEQVRRLDDADFLQRYARPFLLEEGGLRGGGGRQLFELTASVVGVGRHSDSDILIKSPMISKSHAVLKRDSPGQWSLVDAGSKNGSFLNGVRLAAGEARVLQQEDSVRFGPFRYTFLPPASLLALVTRLREATARIRRSSGKATDEEDTASWSGEDTEGYSRTETETHHSGEQEAIAGSLQHVSLAELLLEIEQNHRTGALEIRGIGVQGRIAFRAGKPCEANTKQGHRGLDAICALLREREGWYTLLAQALLVGEGKLPFTFTEAVRHGKRREAKPDQRSSELNELLEGLPGALIVFDEDGSIEAVNAEAESLFGRPAEDLEGSQVDGLFGQDCLPLLESVVLGEARERPGLRGDGTVFPAEVVLNRLANGGRFGYSMGARDVSRRRQAAFELLRTEDALHNTQKMDAVGRLASGITHDFNNMLAVINGYSERLLETELTAVQRKSLERIQSAGERASALTRKLLSLAGRQLVRPTVLEPNALVTEMLDMLTSALGESIQLRFFAGPNVGCVYMDKSQLEQLILNLVLNARDAMPDGGQLTIATTTALLGPEQVESLRDLQPGLYMRLSVSDTGCGIPVADQERLFEPFFTTKSRAKGSGLGLAVVYGVVKQNQGHVVVESQEGEGTTLRVYLPITDEKVREPSSSPRPAPSVNCSETILLVEDEAPVRELVAELLEEWGYQVLLAKSGEEGLARAREHPGVIHALLTDVVMPGMSGPALAAQLTVLRPELRLLFMSGYLEEDAPEGWPVLAKPFRPSALNTKLRELLDSKDVPTDRDTSTMLTRLGRYFNSGDGANSD